MIFSCYTLFILSTYFFFFFFTLISPAAALLYSCQNFYPGMQPLEKQTALNTSSALSVCVWVCVLQGNELCWAVPGPKHPQYHLLFSVSTDPRTTWPQRMSMSSFLPVFHSFPQFLFTLCYSAAVFFHSIIVCLFILFLALSFYFGKIFFSLISLHSVPH